MTLTFGVLGTIIRENSGQASSQLIVSSMVSSIDPNEKYHLKKESMKSATWRLLKCAADFPSPDDTKGATCLLSLLRTHKDPQAIVQHFREKVVDIVLRNQRRRLMFALQDVVRNDPDTRGDHAEVFKEMMGMTANEFVARQSFDLARVLAGMFLYTVSVGRNIQGRTTVAELSLPSYWEELDVGFMVIDSIGSVLTNVADLHGATTYLSSLREKYSKVHTILPGGAVFDFNDLFVCNDIEAPRYAGKTTARIHNATLPMLRNTSQRLIISALGGNGKSMMFLHLLFDAIDHMSERNVLPIFVCLRFYRPDCTSLTAFIAEQVRERWPYFDQALLRAILKNNKTVLLLDGLDEMADEAYEKFKGDIAHFIKVFPETQILISVRPYTEWISGISGFERARLCEFTKAQALELVDRIDRFPDSGVQQTTFRERVDKDLYVSKPELVSNPLLLTAMLMVYAQYGDVPNRRHELFSKIYVILSEQHDSLKDGYRRTYATKLSREMLKTYLAEFAYLAYIKKDWLLTYERCETIYGGLSIRQGEESPTTCADFMTDVTKNLSIMEDDGGMYHFHQHGFLEFFCAYHLATRRARDMKKLRDYFENHRSRTVGDYVFSMMYEMNPTQVDESLILPTLRGAFRKPTVVKEFIGGRTGLTRQRAAFLEGYWAYVLNEYPEIEFMSDPSDESAGTVINPQSAILEFVLHDTQIPTDSKAPDGTVNKRSIFHRDFTDDDFPDEDSIVHEYFYLANGQVLGDQHQADRIAYLRGEGCDLEIIRRDIRVNIAEVVEYPSVYKETIEYMEDDDFPLMREYAALKSHYGTLASVGRLSARNLRDAV